MGVAKRLDLSAHDFDRGASALDAAHRELQGATSRLSRIDAMKGATPIAGGIMAAQIGLARGAAIKADGTAQRQRLTLRRHAALTRIADGHPTGDDFITALPWLQRYDKPNPPKWWEQLHKLMGQVGHGTGTAAKNPSAWLAGFERFFEEHKKRLEAEAERLRRQATTWTWPPGIFGKIKGAAGWVGHKWAEAQRRIKLAVVSVKGAIADAMGKLSLAVGLLIDINNVMTAPNGRESLRAAIKAAVSATGAVFGGMGGAMAGGPLGGAGGAFVGAATGDMFGGWLADQILGPEPEPLPEPIGPNPDL